MGMRINDKIGNVNGKEWETTCMGMGMALIPMGINSHRRMPCLAYVLARKRWIPFFIKVEYHVLYHVLYSSCTISKKVISGVGSAAW